MTTQITPEREQAAREKLPPVERDEAARIAAVQVAVPGDGATANQPTQRQVALGKWFYRHRHATDGFAGYMGYQIVRNILAAIPYAFATAGVWLGFEKLAEKSAAKNANSLTLRFAKSPARDIAMIAAGFTFYRGTLKVVRFMKERLFNPNHTEAEAIEEVQNVGTSLKETLHEVAPAEVASTPAAAFALGLGRRLWDPVKFIGAEALPTHGVSSLFKKPLPEGLTRWGRIKNSLFTRKGNYLTEAAIVAASFVPFFELGDRRYKDAQVSRGIWLNDPSSLVRKSDEQVKRELNANQIFATHAPGQDSLQQEFAQKSADSMKATGHLRPADPPTFNCFVMRRVVPTFIGIGAYVAGKRLAYMGMGTIPENYNASLKGFKGFLNNLVRISLIEGAATSLFWLNASVIDKWEPWYDKHFKDSKPKPLTDAEVRRRYAELKEKLDAKERERQSQTTTIA